MKTKWMHLIAGVTVFALCVSVCTTTTNATVDWSDDFNDGNYEGWTICSPSWGNPPSNWSAANHYLQIEQEDWGTISHSSNIANGTWSFDFKANGTQVTYSRGVSIALISNDINNATKVRTATDWSCYGFKAYGNFEGTGFTLRLLKYHDGVVTHIDYNETPLSLADWHHIDVTRNTTGGFKVYHNSTLVMQGVDTELTTSELFVVSLVDWLMIDNVIINNVVLNITTTPTGTTSEDFDPTVIVAFVAVGAVVIIAVLAIILRRR